MTPIPPNTACTLDSTVLVIERQDTGGCISLLPLMIITVDVVACGDYPDGGNAEIAPLQWTGHA